MPADTSNDRNFDHLAERFERQIYGTDKGRIRTAMVRDDLCQHISWLKESLLKEPDMSSPLTTRPHHIIDAGGGTGLFSAELARDYYVNVSLCDLSSQMLQRAQKNFDDIAPQTTVNIHHAPIQDLDKHITQPGDLVLFHAVIEWLQDPQQVLRQLCTLVKPGGWLSVLFYNKRALIWRHLMMGNFVYTNYPEARLQGNGKTLTPDNPQLLEDVEHWLAEENLTIHARTGIRAIYDNMRPHDLKRSRFEDILAAEQLYGRQRPYLDMARYIHLLCQRPL